MNSEASHEVGESRSPRRKPWEPGDRSISPGWADRNPLWPKSLFRRSAVLKLSCFLLVVVSLLSPVAAAIEVPPGFVAETIATNLNTATALAPATDGRIFIAEQTGRLLVWKEGQLLARPALELRVTDFWERGLIGLTLASDFPRTQQLYVLYVTDRPFVHHVLSRFTVKGDVVDPTSEVILLEGDDQAKLGGFQPAGHQGGALRFGADGKLYIGLGEQTAGEPSQHLDTLQGKILRLNPDGSFPADNPFYTQVTGKYRAICALGVRNPFGLATQPETGRMFFTDVGGSAFEEVNELVPGANYGWPRAEGFSTNAAFRNPLHAYPPVVGRSICGGVFYPKPGLMDSWSDGLVRPLKHDPPVHRSTDPPIHQSISPFPPRWRGKFFFLDFMNHWLKALDPEAPTNVVNFAGGFNGPVAVELAPDGSLLVLNRGTIWRDPKKFATNSGSLVRIRYTGESIVRNEATAGTPVSDPAKRAFTPALRLPADPMHLPRRLSEKDWDERVKLAQSRALGMPDNEWTPPAGARARMFLPHAGRVLLAADGVLVFPPGTVFVREYSIDSTPELDASHPVTRVIERRLHVVGISRSYGASYRLDAAGNGALVEDGELASLGWVRRPTPGGFTNVLANWWFPGLDDRLGLPVLNTSYQVPSVASELNQMSGEEGLNILQELSRRGWLQTNSASPPLASIAPGVRWSDSTATAEDRVRAYLHANCAVCHQPGGASRGQFDARLNTPLDRAGLIQGEPAAGDLGIVSARLVVPGDPGRSILFQRLKRNDFFRMPPVQFHEEPSPMVPVVAEWIRSLKPMEASLK